MWSGVGALSFALGGEGTHTPKFEVGMILASSGSAVNGATRMGIVGGPCQVKPVLRTLRCTSSLRVACGVGLSVVGWILDILFAAQPAPLEFVARVNLLNRYKASHRCRALACQAVNKMAPMCLLGPRSFWQVAVHGQHTWADLCPSNSLTQVEHILYLKTRTGLSHFSPRRACL